jgi:hypothetical protein
MVYGSSRHPSFDHYRSAAHLGHEQRHTQQAAAQLPSKEACDCAG